MIWLLPLANPAFQLSLCALNLTGTGPPRGLDGPDSHILTLVTSSGWQAFPAHPVQRDNSATLSHPKSRYLDSIFTPNTLLAHLLTCTVSISSL